MTVYHETAACFNGFSGKEVLELAALASNPANKDDAIDRSVYQAYAKMVGLGADVDTAATRLAAKWKTDKYFGFNPVIKRTVADVSQVGGGSTMRVAKGIVSKVLKTVEGDGGQQWTCDDYENTCKMVEEADATFGKSGFKTIAIACSVNGGPMKYAETPSPSPTLTRTLTRTLTLTLTRTRYAGTLPIMDPPRVDTAETIQKIKGSGIDVKMITGDHLNIAKELARQIDLGTNIFPNTVLWPASAMRDDLITKADGFAPALAKAQIGIAVEGATDAAQAAADIVLTRPGLSPIYTAVMASRRIFKRLRSYVIYRISVTVQVVVFLSIISFAFNDKFDALYIILLALFHDLTIVTIAYDHQVASPKPETPTVKMLVVVAYSMAMVLATSSTLLYIYGDKFLSAAYSTVFPYKESCLFLQISNSSAILIFNARTIGFSFLSKPHYLLFMSALVSQLFINFILLFGNGFIVEQLDPMDVAKIWIYDFSWLIIIDLVKISILKLQEGPSEGVDATVGRNGMMRSSTSRSKSGTVTRRSGAPKLSKDLRVSLSGAPRKY